MSVSQLEDEDRRLAALQRYGVIGTMPEQVYDDLTLLAAKMLNAPIAALGFIGADRQWFKSTHGANLACLCREESLCNHAIANPMDPTVIPDTWLDPRFCASHLVRNPPYIRSYAGAPLVTPDFHAVGTLCVMDSEPRVFTADQIEMLRTLARQAVSQLELRRQTMLLSAANEKLQTLATCDSLTGLKNFRAFQDSLDDEMVFAARNRSPLSVALIDVDSFKEYNDRFGHPAGDEVLQAISILLLESSREYDCVARYGGEEFAIVLRDADSAEAYAIAERLRTHIAGANWPERTITASIGVATVSSQLNSREALIGEADRLLYEAKQAGKNRVCRDTENEFDPTVWDSAPQLQFSRADPRLAKSTF